MPRRPLDTEPSSAPHGVDVATAIGLTAAASLADRRHFAVIAIELDGGAPPNADLLRTFTAPYPERRRSGHPAAASPMPWPR